MRDEPDITLVALLLSGIEGFAKLPFSLGPVSLDDQTQSSSICSLYEGLRVGAGDAVDLFQQFERFVKPSATTGQTSEGMNGLRLVCKVAGLVQQNDRSLQQL